MPHCTSNFGWYLGKFIAGFTGMLFFYFGFLKEREYRCLCRTRMREFVRRRGENTNSCPIDDLADANAKKEQGTRSMLVGVGNVWTWYTRIREWFLENDPATISETAFALSRGLPKYDNDVSLINCTCRVTLDDRKTKLTDSSTSVRRKQSRRRCLFRHCSGMVCPQRFAKRRRKHRCVHLRVSQDVVLDHWRTCDKPEPDTSRVDDAEVYKSKNTKILYESGQEIANNGVGDLNSFENEGETKDVEKVRRDKVDTEAKTLLEKVCTDHKLSPTSPKLFETEHKEKQCFDDELNGTFSRCTNVWNISEEITNNNNLSPKCVTEGTSEVQRKNSLCRVENTEENQKTSPKKQSRSDISLSEITDNDADSMLHRESRKKRVPFVRKKPSREFISDAGNTNNNDSRRKSNMDETYDNVLAFYSKLKRKYGTKYLANKYRSNWEDICPNINRQGDNTTQKTQAKHFPRNCTCLKRWSHSRRLSSCCQTNLQRKNHPCEHVKSKQKNNDTIAEIRSSRYKAQSSQYKGKPALVTFKNKSFNRSRTLEETYSSCSSSTTFTDITENSFQDDPVVCWCPHDKSSRYVCSTGPRKYNEYNTRIDLNRLTSSSSCLSSSKRYHSSTVMSQQQPMSSSSCTNIPRWKRRYPRTRTYLSSASSSCSLTSLPTYRDDYSLEGSITDRTTCDGLKKNNRIFREETDSVGELKQRSWRSPRCQEKRIMCTDERHVAWNVKNTY